MQNIVEGGSSKTVTKRALQAIETKERIYTCADNLFSTKGYDATTIADIAAAADISVGLFYYYFKNKEEIVRLWLMGLDEKYLDYYENTLCSPEMEHYSTLDKIRKMMETINNLFFSHGITLGRNAYALMLRDKAVGHQTVSPTRLYYKIMENLVTQAWEKGEIKTRSMSVEKLVKQITIISRGCKVEWMLSGCKGDLVQQEDDMLVSFFRTLEKE